MAKRAAHTLLFIASDLIARADFGSSPQLSPRGCWQKPQTGNARLYFSVEAAVELGGPCGRQVWVICEELWTQTLSLPTSALRGLSLEQTGKAIGFDVESLTGVAGNDSAIGFCAAAPSDESEHLWITQVPLAARIQIQSAVEAAGGNLAGILHPGGQRGMIGPSAAASNVPADGRSWRRIEVWRDATFCVLGHGSEILSLSIINGEANPGVWRNSVVNWLAAHEADESQWLGPQGAIIGEAGIEGGRRWMSLPKLSGDLLKSWLAGWARELTQEPTWGKTHTPVIGPNRSGLVRRKQLAAAALVPAAVLAMCIGQFVWLGHQRDLLDAQRVRLVEQVKEAEAPSQLLANLTKKANSLEKELGAQRKANAAHAQPAMQAAPDMELQRQRIGRLLEALARNVNSGLMIDSISPSDDGAAIISGKCLSGMSADEYTRALHAILPGTGWQIMPAQEKPVDVATSGVSEFTLRVVPAVAAQPGQPSQPTAAARTEGGAE